MMQHGDTETAYVMGGSDAELERLVQQAHLFGGQAHGMRNEFSLRRYLAALRSKYVQPFTCLVARHQLLRCIL